MKHTDVGQSGFQKVTSLQAWGKLTEKYLGKKLRVEERKDREEIFTRLTEFGLPHERLIAFDSGENLTRESFLQAVGEIGIPFWISATPKVGVNDLDRLSKLNITNTMDGWEFIEAIERKSDYKFLIMQFASNPVFKGTAIVSRNINGIVDFVKGDRHFFLTAGMSYSDPMLFTSKQIIRYSDLVDKKLQDVLYRYINNHPGHYEFQYATLNESVGFSFFDHNDELAYEDIDRLFQDLVLYFEKPEKNESVVRGLPANLGKAKGTVRVILGSDEESFDSIQKGDVLVTDATNPNMTPYMTRVSAIVADLGGVTSHAAIVCRELGIPSIVGAKNATQKLKDGMRVEVDAFSGEVRSIDEAETNSA